MFCSYDGDLRTQQPTGAPALHRIDVPRYVKDGSAFKLKSRVNLGVGGDGIIGRRVSFVQNSVLVSEGIMGWN